jgi:hypothetical protein
MWRVATLAFVHFLLARYVQPVSRRMVNGAYVLWQLWCHLLVLLSFQLLQLLLPTSACLCSSIDAALSSHALLYFVLSNLATGAVKGLMETRSASEVTALCVLWLYVHCTVALVYMYARAQPIRQMTAALAARRLLEPSSQMKTDRDDGSTVLMSHSRVTDQQVQ